MVEAISRILLLVLPNSIKLLEDVDIWYKILSQVSQICFYIDDEKV